MKTIRKIKRSGRLLDAVVVLVFTFIAAHTLFTHPISIFAAIPNTPSNPDPYDGAVGVPVLDLLLSWTGGGAPGDNITYFVHFGDNQSYQPYVGENTTTESYLLNELNHSTNYYWYVNATDGYGNWSVGPVWTFQTEINDPPTKPYNPDPYDTEQDVPVIGTILSWLCGDPNGDHVTYDVYFGQYQNPELVSFNITNTSYPLGDLNFSTDYSWRIDARDEHGAFTQGDEWQFMTEINNPPYIGNDPINPLNGATGVPIIDVILDWIGSDPDQGDTVTYEVYFGDNETFQPLLADNLSDSIYEGLGSLKLSTDYYWYVNATDNHNFTTTGPLWTFQTRGNNPPYIDPNPTYPQDGATGIPIIDLILNWIGYDPDPGDTVTFDVYFGDNQTYQPLLIDNITETSYEIPYDLNQSTDYYWFINATDNFGAFTEGPLWTFQTEILNNPPVALDQAVATFVDTPVDITLEAEDEQPQNLQYFIVADPQHGALTGTPPDVTYTPDQGYEGKDLFTFKAFDGVHYSNVATVDIYIWRDEGRLDSGDGSRPMTTYSPDGDLRVFYSLADYYTFSHMVVRTRLASQQSFGSEKFVLDDAKQVTIHYDASGVLDLAVDTVDTVVVLQSLDAGNTWNQIKTYAGSEAGYFFDNSEPVALTEDDGDLRLFYNYKFWTLWPEVNAYSAERRNNTWDNTGSYFKEEGVGYAYEKGDKVSVFTSAGIYHSQDNGITYELIDDGGTIPDKLSAADVAVDSDGTLYLIRSYSYGPGPDNRQLIIRSSDNDGTDWNEKQFIVENGSMYEYIIRPQLAADGDNLVAVWLDYAAANETRFLKCSVSNDGGDTWSPPYVLRYIDAPYELSRIDMAVYDNIFSLAYSLTINSDNAGVYLLELDLTNQPLNPPDAPTNLVATAQSSSRIDLVWQDNSDNEDEFEIERCLDGVNFQHHDTVPADHTTYSDLGLQKNTTYYYRVRAVNQAGNSDYSNVASATTKNSMPYTPAVAILYLRAPSNLTATAVSASQIDLAWQDNSNGEAGFKIERKTQSSSFQEIDTVGANITVYNDINLQPNTYYEYRVRAYKGPSYSKYSNTAGDTTF